MGHSHSGVLPPVRSCCLSMYQTHVISDSMRASLPWCDRHLGVPALVAFTAIGSAVGTWLYGAKVIEKKCVTQQ